MIAFRIFNDYSNTYDYDCLTVYTLLLGYDDDDDYEDMYSRTPINYQIDLVTGHETYAGTDAKVYVQLFGKKNQQTHEEYLPDDGTDKFEKGRTDTFRVRLSRSSF